MNDEGFVDLRRKAEKLLSKQPAYWQELSPEDARRLVHELRVHQIELEMQNEELRQAQQALEASRDRYADLYDFAPVGYFTLSETGLILAANLTCASMLGVERGNLIKQPLSRFIVAEDQDIYYIHHRKLIKTQAPQVFEIRLVKKDDSQFYARIETTMANEDDVPVCRATVSDVTEQVRAENALRQAHDELEMRVQERTAELMRANEELKNEIAERKRIEKALELSQVIVRNMAEGVCLVRAKDTSIVYTNPRFEQMFGYERSELVGKPLTIVNYEGEGQSAGQVIHQIIEKLAEHSEATYEVQNIRKDGTLIWCLVHTSEFEHPEYGRVWVAVHQDITELRAAQERSRQQERLAAVGQLAAGIAHDFNNILTSMMGYAELVSVRSNIPKSARQNLERIIQQGQRAAHLVRQILDFSRKSIIQKQALGLAPCVKESVKLLKHTIPENIHISVAIEPDCEASTVKADPTRIQQLLTNLAVNARDAMPGGGALRFHLSKLTLEPGEPLPSPVFDELPEDGRSRPENWLVLSVSDTGCGIASAVLPHIFEPFFTTKEVGQGTGLGLAQVYGIVKQHEGYIDVTSQAGQGTTLIIYLPALPPSPAASPPIETEISRGGGEVILLVEDELVVLDTIKAMLEHLGYQVLTAIDGQRAMEVYDRHQAEIALVLTDMNMPEMGGVALSQVLGQRDPTIKVVVLTGYPLEAEAEALLTQGAVDWLQKPVQLRQLAQAVSQALRP